MKIFKLFFLLPIFFFCSKLEKNSLILKDGILDIQNWSPTKSSILKLSGAWEFYPKQFLIPEDFENNKTNSGKLFHKVNSSWNEILFEEKKLGSEAFGTYRLIILTKKDYENKAIYFASFSTASRIWLNGKGIFASGKVSREAKDHIPSYKNGFFHFPVDKEEIEIIIQVSNFNYPKGGIDTDIFFGNEDEIQSLRDSNLFSDLFLFGILSALSVYNLVIYLIRRKDKQALYFAIFCFISSLNIGTQREKIFSEFFNLSWLMNLKLFYLSFNFVAFSLYLYSKEMIQILYEKFFSKLFFTIIPISSLIILFTGSSFFPLIFEPFLFFQTTLGVLVFFFMITTFLKTKSKDDFLFIISYSVLFLFYSYEQFQRDFEVQIENLPPMGLIFFSFVQAILLAKKFSKGFQLSEKLSEELEHQNEKLKNLDKLKDEFLSNTSHELKTPLHGIIGITESLIDGVSGNLNHEAKKNLSLILMSGKRLNNLINDILDFSKLKNHDLNIKKQSLDLKMILEMVITLLNPLAKQKNLIIESNISEIKVLGDEDRIQQIFLNLIGNSIKFTDEGKISIQAEIKNDIVQIQVKDTGIGIPKEKLETIFLSFEQVDSSISRIYGGTGIGLSIVKKLVELHGGKVWAESEEEKGTSIFFTLTLSNLKEVENNPEIKEKLITSEQDTLVLSNEAKEISIPQPNRIRILIVDDEPINLQILENQLSINNYEIFRSINGEEVIDLIKNKKIIPDLILLDVMMPKLSGYETCKIIREEFSESELPILMLTAKNRLQDLIEGFSSGANDYLAKPFSKDELLTRIKSHLNLLKTNRSTRRFFPNEYLEFLSKESILDIELGDHISKEMTVMFSDIRSFTTISEQMTPKENFDFVNSYLSEMSPVIQKNQGIIVKFLGDGFMALFPNQSIDAILAAQDLQVALENYNSKRILENKIPIQVGIGIHYGKMMMGLVGNSSRLQGDAFSDSVNLAARVESLTKQYNASVIITEDVKKNIREEYQTRYLDYVIVKGKTAPVKLFELLNLEIDFLKLNYLENYKEAVYAFYQTEFIESKKLFLEISKLNPDDKAVQNFLNRINIFEKEGIPENWDGRNLMTEK